MFLRCEKVTKKLLLCGLQIFNNIAYFGEVMKYFKVKLNNLSQAVDLFLFLEKALND